MSSYERCSQNSRWRISMDRSADRLPAEMGARASTETLTRYTVHDKRGTEAME